MRTYVCQCLLLVIGIFAAAGGNCLNIPGVPTGEFPKTVAWTPRIISDDAPDTAVRPVAVAAADFDEDSRLDVAVAYAGTDSAPPSIVILFQTDVDNFSAVEIEASAEMAGVAAMAVADLDGDGQLDIVVASDGRLSYLHSPATPRSSGGWQRSTIAESTGDDFGQWNDVVVGNIDNANGPDLVACNATPGRLCWFRSPAANTSGSGWTRIDIDTTTRDNAAAVLLQDIDGDGDLDIFSSAPGEDTARIAWYRRPTNPQTTADWVKHSVGNLGAASRMALGDLNVDGRGDVVAINGPGRQIGWYRRPSNPTADPDTSWSGFLLTQFTTPQPVDLKVVDVDGNNQPDVVAATESAGTLRWFTPEDIQTEQWIENNLRDLTYTPGLITLGDVDGDGRSDVIVPLQGSNTSLDRVAWFENPE